MLQFFIFPLQELQEYVILILISIKWTPLIILTTKIFTRGRSWHGKIKANIITEDISAISTPPGCLLGSNNPEDPINFDFLDLECNHQGLKQLEPENLTKRAKI